MYSNTYGLCVFYLIFLWFIYLVFPYFYDSLEYLSGIFSEIEGKQTFSRS